MRLAPSPPITGRGTSDPCALHALAICSMDQSYCWKGSRTHAGGSAQGSPLQQHQALLCRLCRFAESELRSFRQRRPTLVARRSLIPRISTPGDFPRHRVLLPRTVRRQSSGWRGSGQSPTLLSASVVAANPVAVSPLHLFQPLTIRPVARRRRPPWFPVSGSFLSALVSAMADPDNHFIELAWTACVDHSPWLQKAFGGRPTFRNYGRIATLHHLAKSSTAICWFKVWLSPPPAASSATKPRLRMRLRSPRVLRRMPGFWRICPSGRHQQWLNAEAACFAGGR